MEINLTQKAIEQQPNETGQKIYLTLLINFKNFIKYRLMFYITGHWDLKVLYQRDEDPPS